MKFVLQCISKQSLNADSLNAKYLNAKIWTYFVIKFVTVLK